MYSFKLPYQHTSQLNRTYRNNLLLKLLPPSSQLHDHVHKDEPKTAPTSATKPNQAYEAVHGKMNDLYKRYQPKVLGLVSRYEQYSGLAEVKQCQDRVIELQAQLQAIQEERRELHEQIIQIQNDRDRLQEEINSKTKGQQEWFELIKKEYETSETQKGLTEKLKLVEREERDYFTNLSNAVRDSHEKQRWQSDRTKYWGLILGVASSLITLLFSNWRYRVMVHDLVDKVTSSDRVGLLIDDLKAVSHDLNQITRTNLKSLNTLNEFENMIKTLNKTLDTNNANVISTLSRFETLVNSLNKTHVATFKNLDKMMTSNRDELITEFKRDKAEHAQSDEYAHDRAEQELGRFERDFKVTALTSIVVGAMLITMVFWR